MFTPCNDDSCQWVEGGDDLTMTVSHRQTQPWSRADR
jgi:hypothetical protein